MFSLNDSIIAAGFKLPEDKPKQDTSVTMIITTGVPMFDLPFPDLDWETRALYAMVELEFPSVIGSHYVSFQGDV